MQPFWPFGPIRADGFDPEREATGGPIFITMASEPPTSWYRQHRLQQEAASRRRRSAIEYQASEQLSMSEAVRRTSAQSGGLRLILDTGRQVMGKVLAVNDEIVMVRGANRVHLLGLAHLVACSPCATPPDEPQLATVPAASDISEFLDWAQFNQIPIEAWIHGQHDPLVGLVASVGSQLFAIRIHGGTRIQYSPEGLTYVSLEALTEVSVRA